MSSSLPTGGLSPRDPSRAPSRIRGFFTSIVRRYDRINRVMSLGMDLGWREAAADEVAGAPPGLVLDVGVGTGDLALAVSRRGRCIVGVDFCRPMLQAARPKVADVSVALVEGDALALPVPDASYAAVMAGFSLRNVADLDRALCEAYRVTRPGGRFVSLEMCPPRRWRWAHWLYQQVAMPVLGACFGGAVSAYRYLPVSIQTFPDAEGLVQRMEAAGWWQVRYRTLGLGAVAVHVATRPH
ncbi:MAG: ubiquinone/menaquinone biosynthesis methyltransferase [Chloroflexi bacterium]|nr:ubiquinone/menaquinone biosynthesis methyltransferase [Chloroflexota bacterium]MBU1750325.1 ubiquinone/menaquinone biosynthesis methyltransferase [Chloroflexota bacterium]